jgi:hypothetical protein
MENGNWDIETGRWGCFYFPFSIFYFLTSLSGLSAVICAGGKRYHKEGSFDD